MNFAIYAREGVSRRSRAAVEASISQINRSLREWDKLVDEALEHPRLSIGSRRFIREQWYGDPRGGPLSMGNRAVHRAATIASVIVLLVHAQTERLARMGRLRLRMLTTTPDVGIADFHAPTVSLASVCRHFDKAARAAGTDAFGFIDIAVLEDRDGVPGSLIAFHMHGAIRATGPWFRIKNAERAATGKSARNQLGLKVCKISSRRRDWGPALKRRHVALLGYYISKRSCGRKIIFNDGGKRKTKTTLHRWSAIEVLRQLECYSHCDVLETTRGVGQGKQWRSTWKKILLRLLNYRTPLRGLKIDHEKLHRQWRRIWTELGVGEMYALQA